MAQIERIRMFLASPGDVQAERGLVREVVTEINRTLGSQQAFVIEVIGWETHTSPDFGADPQSLVNKQIGDMADYDLFVGIMWNRFGQPTPHAGSGTEEEFRRAVAALALHARPRIMLYFSDKAANLSTEEQLEQKAKVIRFRKELESQALYASYGGPEEFAPKFRGDLLRWIAEHGTSTSRPPSVAEPSSREAVQRVAAVVEPARIVSSSGDWVLLGTGFFHASSIREHSDGTVAVQVAPRTTEEDAALRALRRGPYGSAEPIAYGYQNDGFFARIQDAQLMSSAGESTWEITLRWDQDARAGNTHEMGYQGLSADDIATMRARLLLLDDKPILRGSSGSLADQMLVSLVAGLDGPKVTEGALKNLWKELGSEKDAFLEIARLWAVFLLKTTGTVEQILELTLGPIQDDEMTVRFLGLRRKVYSNTAATTITVQGECRLAG